MKSLFLDFDGVLNSTQSTRMHWQRNGRQTIFVSEEFMCPVSCSNLQYLMEAIPDLNIVISSSWRVFHPFEELKTMLKKLCDIEPERILDITPKFRGLKEGGDFHKRGEEIQAWLDENTKVPSGSILMPKFQVDDFMIIDDDSDMAHLKETNFLQTDHDLGFTIKDCRKLIARFRPSVDPVKELREDW